MPNYRKAALAIIIVCLTVAVMPSTVAGLEEPNWGDKNEAFDHKSTDTTLQKGFVDVKESTVQFRANFSGGFVGTYLIYIDTDTDPETGFNKDTVNANDDLSDFYDDAFGSIGADYRVLVVDGATPIIEEHNGDAGWDKIKNINTAGDSDGITAQIAKETIGNPEVYDLRFAHIKDGAGPQLADSEYATEPGQAYRVDEGGDSTGTTETATIKTDVEFGNVKVDDEASVQLTVTDDTGQEAGAVEFNYSSSGTTNLQEFTVNPDNFDEDEGEVSVEVLNDDQYLFERDVDNTDSITGISDGGDSTTVNLGVSTIRAKLDNVNVLNDDASARLELTDNGEDKTTTREVPINNSKTSQDVYFTVNPDNFATNNELKVEILGDSDYPFEDSDQSISITKGSSATTSFDVDSVGHDITIIDKSANRNIDGGNGDAGFTVGVELSSDGTDGSDIYTFSHVLEYDSERLSVEDVSTGSASEALPLVSANGESDNANYTVVTNNRPESPGEHGITITSNTSTNNDPAVVYKGTSEDLYNIEFEFDDPDSLSEEIDYDEKIDLAPSTADETVLAKADGTSLSYTSSAESTNVYNNNTRVTDVEVTHLTEGGNMVNAPMKFEFDIGTNNGEIDEIRLTDNTTETALGEGGSSDDDTRINCNGESTCDGTLVYTPDKSANSTFSGSGYGKNEDFEVIVVDSDSDKYSIPDDNEEIDNLDAKIYTDGDTSAATTPGATNLSDLTTVVRNRGEGDGELPWDDDKLARADMNNDGVIDVVDVTNIAGEYSP